MGIGFGWAMEESNAYMEQNPAKETTHHSLDTSIRPKQYQPS